MTWQESACFLVNVHEQPLPLPHFYSILDVISGTSATQRGFRCCPTTRAITYRQTNCIIIVIIIVVITKNLENAKLTYGRPRRVV